MNPFFDEAGGFRRSTKSHLVRMKTPFLDYLCFLIMIYWN